MLVECKVFYIDLVVVAVAIILFWRMRRLEKAFMARSDWTLLKSIKEEKKMSKWSEFVEKVRNAFKRKEKPAPVQAPAQPAAKPLVKFEPKTATSTSYDDDGAMESTAQLFAEADEEEKAKPRVVPAKLVMKPHEGEVPKVERKPAPREVPKTRDGTYRISIL